MISISIGPFAGGETHVLAIEVRGRRGYHSGVTVRIQVVQSRFKRDLLVVNDTRFPGDELGVGGCVKSAIGPLAHGSGARHVSLRARGNAVALLSARRRDACDHTAGALRRIFVRHDRNARAGRRPADLARRAQPVSPRDLAHGRGCRAQPAPARDPYAPITAFGGCRAPGRRTRWPSTRGGGDVWLVGAGVASATLLPWSDQGADSSTWSSDAGDLIPGRFLYDIVHWRSELQARPCAGFVQRELGRNPSWPGAPDYTRLPITLRGKSSALDPLPPGRVGQNSGVFYKSTFDFEFLTQPNAIVEDLDPSHHGHDVQSVLDSLYKLTTSGLPASPEKRVLMTFYHGSENGPVVFSGLDVWDFTWSDAQALVDFVLQDIWDMQKYPGSGNWRARRPEAVAAHRPICTAAPASSSSTAVTDDDPTGPPLRRVPFPLISGVRFPPWPTNSSSRCRIWARSFRPTARSSKASTSRSTSAPRSACWA